MPTKSLGNLERKVMDVVWDEKKCTVNDVLSSFPRGKKVAYTTIATILQRLHDKGLVSKGPGGKAYVYSAEISRRDYAKGFAKSFILKFFDSFGDAATASFAESVGALPKKKRESFLRLLKK